MMLPTNPAVNPATLLSASQEISRPPAPPPTMPRAVLSTIPGAWRSGDTARAMTLSTTPVTIHTTIPMPAPSRKKGSAGGSTAPCVARRGAERARA